MKTKQLTGLCALVSASMLTSHVIAQTTANVRGPVPSPSPLNTDIEPIGGISNNVANPLWGSAETDLLRLAPVGYADGIDAPALPNDLSARAISDIINNQADPADPSQDIQTVDQNSLSDFGYSFGQFMDHDMDLTLDNGVSDPILVPLGDPIGGTNDTPLYFDRVTPDPLTGLSRANPAQDINAISSYFDLSQIYGSDVPTDDALRTFAGGLMKTSPGGLPPLCNSNYFTPAQLAVINAYEGGMADAGPLPESSMFVTGDTRGNENLELTVLQALFLDNHNRIAGQLAQANPTWTDEQLFQKARRLNIAEYQSVIYNEWIPAVLGQRAVPAYTGYKPGVNAAVDTEFSTVAFRFGHSLLSGGAERQGNNGLEVADTVSLAVDFFDPMLLNGQGQPQGIDPVTGLATTSIGAILKANADGNAQAMDVEVINEVRDLLFNEVIPGVGGGQDLIALDTQRGRDMGIPDYNTLRVSLGLPAISRFSQITRNVRVQQELAAAYPGGVNTIDAFEGGLAEDHVPGSDVGPLFQKIMADQFTRLRDGDRFFYLNEGFTPQEMQIFGQGNTLAKIIMNNTEITNLQDDVIIFQASISGTVSVGSNGRSGGPNSGASGITVELEDTVGDILATTQTDQRGGYSFDQLSGPSGNPEIAPGVSATGYYQIVVAVPHGMKQASPNPAPILISRGDTDVNGVNFVLASPQTRPSGGPSWQ
ncbi:MAG TPA: peroxidase family protein [Verrucomicrobiae bacterium]|jgi:peroxidase|nr:peroxidase family protein [Verrucomicrobiae bacterium]